MAGQQAGPCSTLEAAAAKRPQSGGAADVQRHPSCQQPPVPRPEVVVGCWLIVVVVG